MKNPDLTDKAPWFLFPWFPEHGEQHIHPDDLFAVRSESPYGHVFEHLETSDGLVRLRYSGGIIRVRPELLRSVTSPKFPYAACVSTVAPRSPVTGIIHAIRWHHGDSAHLFYLSVGGAPFRTRYRTNELQPCA